MFDAALLESRRVRRFGDRKKSLPIAIGLHAAVVAALVGAAVWNTGEPPEPVIPVVFSLPSPPPRGTGGHPATETKRSDQPHRAAAAMSEIREAPPVSQTAAASDPGTSAFEDPGTDDPIGDPLGIDGGTGDQPAIGEPGLDDGPIVITRDVKAPVLLSRIEPDYPESMRRAHKEGVVILEAVITASGDVDDVRILKSEGAVLDRAASDAVRRWRYRPATLNGRAVSVYLTVTVTFGIRN